MSIKPSRAVSRKDSFLLKDTSQVQEAANIAALAIRSHFLRTRAREWSDQPLRWHAIVSASSTAQRDSMRPTIGTAGIRYRQTSRVWTPAAVMIEAAHITITIPARVENPGRRRHRAVTVQNMTAITKAMDKAMYRLVEMPGRSDSRPIRTGPPCRSIG